MSKRVISRKPRVLIDTAFLSLALGVEAEEDAMKAIELFRRLEINYLEIEVLEAIRKYLKPHP